MEGEGNIEKKNNKEESFFRNKDDIEKDLYELFTRDRESFISFYSILKNIIENNKLHDVAKRYFISQEVEEKLRNLENLRNLPDKKYLNKLYNEFDNYIQNTEELLFFSFKTMKDIIKANNIVTGKIEIDENFELYINPYIKHYLIQSRRDTKKY